MSLRRDDLLLLSPQALAHASNAGIVKRAERELASGTRPQLSVDATGTLEAVFGDGTRCTWPQGAGIQNARCSCNASGVCRHRVIAALAYCADAASQDGPAAADAIASPVDQASDAQLEATIPAALLAQAAVLRDAGISIELTRAGGGEPCETARLPSATVRYWAGAALENARCDCVRATACEHVALGVWAFRAAREQDPASSRLTVRLGTQGARHVLDRGPFEQLAEAIVRHGVAQGNAALMQGLTAARGAAADAAWLDLVVTDLETWSAAYARRSALYDATLGVDLLAELALRLAAGQLAGHASAVLGTGQAGETALDRLRMICLGARTRCDGNTRETTLLMADVDNGTRLVLPHTWQVPQAHQADEATIRAAERLAPGVKLEALAQGQLLAQQAARRPDGSVRLARARSSQNSVLPQAADWSSLGSPVRFDSVAALRDELRAHPSAALQPRHAGRRFVVFTPATAEEPTYDAAAQCVSIVLRDAQEEALLVQRFHQRHVPHALDAIAHAARNGLRHVAGVLDWDHGLPVLEPWALGCEGQAVMPDFSGPHGALPVLPLGSAHLANEDPCTRQLQALRQHLAALLHHGLHQLPQAWSGETGALARQLDLAGLRVLSQRLQALGAVLAAAQAASTSSAAALAPALLELLALRQLHEDAAVAQYLQ